MTLEPLHHHVGSLILQAPQGSGEMSASSVLIALPAPDVAQLESNRPLSELYGLTPTEAKLAHHTLRGETLEYAARALGMAETTARTHMRHIFAKTNTSRQGELISALLHGPAMLQQPSTQ
jgi:DNA-binding CsgD family transcriptional regulator